LTTWQCILSAELTKNALLKILRVIRSVSFLKSEFTKKLYKTCKLDHSV